jgi:hypothetical protein
MSAHIDWLAFLTVGSVEEAEGLLGELAHRLGVQITVRECERDRKHQSLFRAAFASLLDNEAWPAAVLEVLQICWRIARYWEIRSPDHYAGGFWEFNGDALAAWIIDFTGVAHLSFRAGNVEEDGSVPPPPTPKSANAPPATLG